MSTIVYQRHQQKHLCVRHLALLAGAPRLTLAKVKAKETLEESRKGRVRMPDGSYAKPAAAI